MAIPQFQEFMTPTLNALKDGNARTHVEVEDIICPIMGISLSDRKELLPSGTQTIVRNRLSWALYYMYRAGLLARKGRGVYVITQAGKQALDTGSKIDNKFLEQYSSFNELIWPFPCPTRCIFMQALIQFFPGGGKIKRFFEQIADWIKSLILYVSALIRSK